MITIFSSLLISGLNDVRLRSIFRYSKIALKINKITKQKTVIINDIPIIFVYGTNDVLRKIGFSNMFGFLNKFRFSTKIWIFAQR